MFLKLIDSVTGTEYYVPTDRLVLIYRLDESNYEVTFSGPRPEPEAELRTVRLRGEDAKALLAYIERNLFKGGGR